jgi:hypothetical protein
MPRGKHGHEKKSAHTGGYKSPAQGGNEPPKLPVAPPPQPPESTPPPDGDPTPHDKPNEKREQLRTAVQVIGLVVLVVYTIFTGLMWGANQTAADAAKNAAQTAKDALVIGNRPWIKITPGIIKPLTFNELKQHGPMAMMTIQNRVENVGNSVALNVLVYEELIPVGFDIRAALDRRKERCELYRKTQQPDAGTVIFAKDTSTGGQGVGPSMADIQKVMDSTPQLKGKIGFVLVGCASYRSSFEPESTPRHETFFFYWLGVLGPSGNGMNPWVDPTGTASQLTLIGTPLYFSAD